MTARRLALPALLAATACADPATGPAPITTTYDVVLVSVDGTCEFADDPIPAELEVERRGDELTLTLDVPEALQVFVYEGEIDGDGTFVAVLVAARPPLMFTAESRVEGVLTETAIAALEEFEISNALPFGQPDCVDIAEWTGTRR